IELRCRVGGMFSVLSNATLMQEFVLAGHCELAAVNGSAHFVLSAPHQHLPTVERFLRSRCVPFQRLPVGYPFHSRWLDDSRDALLEMSRRLATKPATIPVACTAAARIVAALPADHFWSSVRLPIRFVEMVSALEKAGPFRYIDVGPSGTLGTILNRSLPRS